MNYPEQYNAAVALIAPNLDAGRESKPAFIDTHRQLSYGELDEQTNRMANLLLASGLRREDRIAVIALDTIDFPVIFLGAIKAGIIPIALNTLLSSEQYRTILNDCRARALFVSAPLSATLRSVAASMPDLKSYIIGDETPYDSSHDGPDPASVNFDAEDFSRALNKQSASFDAVASNADEVAFWLYSSGSTGMPKGVPHVHTSMMETSRLYAQGVLGLNEHDVVFSAAKFYFAYGLGNSLSFPLSVGATTVLHDGRPTPEMVFAMVEKHQPTLFFGAPTLYAALLAHSGSIDGVDSSPDLGHIRLCLSAGEALPADIGLTWKAHFGVDILDGVGSTELLHVFLSNAPDNIHYGKSGTPVPGYDVRLVDENDIDVADNELGELLVRGNTAAVGYWNNRAKTRSTFRGEWTLTGDKYLRDDKGLFTYCGRTDDLFKVSGLWLSPFEVESALVSHSSVLESAVVPYQDADDLTKTRAFVVLNEGESADGKFELLKEHVKKSIGKWKYPRDIRFVDSLPKTATGKIQRFKLRD